MANYNIDFLVSIKNTNKLVAFNKQLDQTGKKVRETVQGLSEIGQTSKFGIANIIGYGNALKKAQTSFNEAVRGAKEFKAVSRELVNAERQYNAELQKRQAILESIRKGSNFAQFSRGASQISGPTVFDTATQKSIDRNRRNQNRRAGRNPVPFGPQPFIGPLPMQGPMFGPMQGPMPMITVDNNPRILRNLEASRISREASGFGIRPGTQYERPIGPAFSAVMKSQLRHQKKIDKNTGKTAQLLSASNNRAIFSNQIAGGTQYSTPIGPSRAPLLNRLGFGQGANPRGPFANSRGRAGRLSGSISSGLIGGGFPLLFGQGGLAAAGGGIGGLAGGALGGGFGFGLSIAGTAIASRIQETIDFRKSIEDLNRSIAATGGQSQFTAGQVQKFAKSMKMTKEEALEALKAFEQFGAAARISLTKVFGDEATFNMLSSLKDNASILNRMDEITKNLGFEQAGLVLQILDTQGARAAENKILELTIEKNKKLNLQIKERVGAEGRLRKIRKEQRAEDELRVQQEINNAKTILDLQIRRTEELRKQAILKAPIDEMEKLSDALFQVDALGKSIGNSFSESFKGIVSGSMTAQQALRNLFQRTADHFLDMAAQMLAAQIRSGIFGIFKSFMGLGPLGNPLSRATNTSVAATGIPSGDLLLPGSFGISTIDRSTPNVRGSGMFGRRASGGPVMGGGSYLVGERGPEMFTPGVSGMVTPNHALGGSTNIVVNVDASGSNVEGDEEQGKELGRLISVAVQSEIIQQQRPGGLLA